MPTIASRTALLTLAALTSAALVAPPRGGAQSEVKPTPTCAGVSTVDPEGDQSQGGANSDVTATFFVTREGTTTFNIRIKDLTDEIPTGFTALTWYGLWTDAAGAFKYVSADIDFNGDTSYSYGTLEVGRFTPEGETTGKLHTGPEGVVELVIPSALTADGTLAAPYADARLARSVPGVGGVVSQADRAPDEGGGTDYVIQECAAGAPVPPEPPKPPASSGGGDGGGDGGTGGGNGGGSTPPPTGGGTATTAPSQTATLPITLSTRSVRSGKAFRFRVGARQTVTKVAARLLSGKKTVATGRLAKVGKRSTLKLKGKRKLKKGRYVLELTGLDAQGRRGSVAFRVRLR